MLPLCLLLLLYSASLLCVSHEMLADTLKPVLRGLFAANLAFCIVGCILASTHWPGVCVVPGPFAWLPVLVWYWPIFILRYLTLRKLDLQSTPF